MTFIDFFKYFFKKEKPQIISYIELNNIIPYSLLRFEQLIEDYQYANGEEQKQ